MSTLLRTRERLDRYESYGLNDMTGEVHGHLGQIAAFGIGGVLLFCLALAIIA